MLTSLTLPALTLLAGIPFFGPRPAATPTARDSLPPAWKPVSRLTLENQFVFTMMRPIGRRPGSPGLELHSDPRVLHVSLDPDSGTVRSVIQLGEQPVGPSSRRSLAQFSQEMSTSTFRRLWLDKTRTSINSRNEALTGTAPRTGLQFNLPVQLPARIQSILGPGGPALNVSGSENIKLSGQSDWTNQQVGLLGQRRSLFPTLNMQQDLDIRLEGQLSDRIKVNLLQNSANQVPLANRIAINYRGDEDDLVQILDLGNTNLSLPGTQYVSYSGKNEGLFGVKASSRYGPLDFTILASKQEGKSERASYAGGSFKDERTLYDFDYVKGTYFFLYDPNLEALEIDDASLNVYYDDDDFRNNAEAARGRAFLDPRDLSADSVRYVDGNFTQLIPGADQDYVLLNNEFYGKYYKVLRLNKRQLSGNQTLAVSYRARPAGSTGTFDIQIGGQAVPDTGGTTRLALKLIRAPARELRADPTGTVYLPDTEWPKNATRELELKNVYQLPAQRIDPATFKLVVRQGDEQPPKLSISTTTVPYMEAVGLDNFDETGGVPVRGHDERVDGTLPTSTGRVFVDFTTGTLAFFDLRPFAPRIDPANGSKPFERFLSSFLNRRDSLVGPAPSPTAAIAPNASNPAIYDLYTPRRDLNSLYRIDVQFTAAVAAGEITLGRGNILEGSEVVTVNGQAWTRDRDYTIDYDLGRVVLKRQLGPSDNLNVDYSYAPLFQQAGRTLVGSAFRLEGREKSFGGAFLYESKGAQDLRPRLGEEPSRSIIGDVNTDWTFRPEWMTHLVDALPGVRTTTASELRVQAEVGGSLPNPNTRNEVFIDDMEGIRDAISLSMGPERWRWSSLPLLRSGAASTVPASDSLGLAELHWYSPPAAVQEEDLKPNLTEAQGGKNARQVLALSVPRRPTTIADPNARLWAGLTYPLDAVGIDLSRSQFIELWVNDFNDLHAGFPGDGLGRVRGRHVKLHIDLGVVSEDQMRSPDVPPNNTMDTEDKGAVPDNQLTVTDENNEDTGYDGILDPQEQGAVPLRDLITATPFDPQGDDFEPPSDDLSRDERKALDPRNWVRANGTEDNKNVNPTPDTEDLNVNGLLDLENNYIEYTIDLGDTASPYLVTDVLRDFGSLFPVTAGPENGWRRFRIPIQDSLAVRFGSPNLTLARHVRVWLEGIVESDSSAAEDRKPLVVLGSLDIVGSRWQQAELDSALEAEGATLTLNTVNSVDNADVYAPPFDPGQTRNGSQEVTRREQSLALEFTKLSPGGTVEGFKTFSLDENYSRYGKLDWYAAGFDIDGYTAADSGLFYFVRFASDELGKNYYEYRAPVPPSSGPRAIGWREVGLELTRLSNLKLDPAFPNSDLTPHFVAPGPYGGDSLIVHGRPSFTRLRRISFGVVNLSGQTYDSGQLWFDELRATDVARDADHAQRVQVNGRLANLLSYNFGWNGRGADFLTVGESRGAGNSSDQMSFSSTFDLHRFFERTGIVLPVSVSMSRNSSKPRFTAGDDVVRTGALAEASETRTEGRSFTTSYSRTWSDRSNPLLRYTLGGITASYGWNQSKGLSPVSRDSSVTTALAVNYQIAPRRLLPVELPFTKGRFFPLPERFYWNYSAGTTSGRSFERVGPLRDTLRLRNQVDGRTGFIDFGADTRPFDFLHHHVEARRNLTLPDSIIQHDPIGRLGSLNLGRVVSWKQSTDARYTLSGGDWLRPGFSWNSTYLQNNGPELSSDLSVRQIQNAQGATVTWDLPFDRLTSRIAAPSPADTGRARRRTSFAWRSWLSRIGTLQTDAAFNKSSSWSRIRGTPSPLYLFGFSSDPDTSSVSTVFGNDITDALDWRAGARTRLALGLRSLINTRYDISARRGTTNGVTNRQTTVRFPDLDVEYGDVVKAIRLDKVFNTPQIRTAFNRAQVRDYVNNSSTITGRSTSSEWRPLVGLTGALKNGARTELRVERRTTQRENLLLGHSITTDRNTTVNFSLNRSYTQGQKVNVLGKTTTVNSTVTVGLTGQYEVLSGETQQFNPLTGEKTGVQFPKEEDRLSVNGNGSYAFSSNVTGNVLLGYGQSHDKQRDIVRRNVRVELRAQFTF